MSSTIFKNMLSNSFWVFQKNKSKRVLWRKCGAVKKSVKNVTKKSATYERFSRMYKYSIW